MRYKWAQGDIIRNKYSGEAYMVIFHHYKVGSIIADLTDSSPNPVMLFERDYPDFAKDSDMIQIDGQWRYENPFENI